MANVRSSNSKLLAVGFAVLVVGVLLVLVIIRNTDDPPTEPSPVAADQTEQADEPAADPTPMTPEQLSTARLPLPLDVPEGTEAMAVRVDFMRSVAAIPSPGDRVNVYRYLAARPAEGQEGPEVQQPVAPSSLPEPGPDSEQVLPDVEVLAVTGPLPASNDGTLTVVLAIPTADVPSMMPLANANQLWFTLLPDTDEASDESTEEPA